MYDLTAAADVEAACPSDSLKAVSRASVTAASDTAASDTAASVTGAGDTGSAGQWSAASPELSAGVARLAVCQLRRGLGRQSLEKAVGQAVVEALVASGVDLRHPPTLEEIKELVCQVARAARLEHLGHSA